MPLVDPKTFERLLKQKAIAETGEALYTVKHDGVTYSPGGEKFSCTEVSPPSTEPSDSKPKEVSPPSRNSTNKTTKVTAKGGPTDDES